MPFLPDELPTRERHVMLTMLAAGAWLSAVAGYVNGAVLSWSGIPVSHMSGAATHLSFNLAGYHESRLLLIVAVIAAFFVGAVVSGAVIGTRGFYLGGRYGVALLLEAALLTVAGGLAWRGSAWAAPAAAMACGLQNAMAASFRGLVVRTTHVTGIVTDLGLLVGHRLRRHPVSAYQVALLTLLLTGFIAGGITGVLGVHGLGPAAVALPAAPCALVGGWYLLWRVHVRRRTVLTVRD